jgi:hypothetical protein
MENIGGDMVPQLTLNFGGAGKPRADGASSQRLSE